MEFKKIIKDILDDEPDVTVEEIHQELDWICEVHSANLNSDIGSPRLATVERMIKEIKAEQAPEF